MKVSKKRLLAALGVLVAVAMIGTGCSGGSGGSSSGGASSGPVTVKIGIGAPLTAGDTALGQGMKRGADLAIQEANASETVKAAGITFEGVDGDDQSKPEIGTKVAETFAGTKGLIGVMGHLNSTVSIATSKVYNESNLVQISPASTNDQLTAQGFTNVFRVCTVDSVQGPAGADFAAKDLAYKTVYIVDDSSTYGSGLADQFVKQFTADGGKMLKRDKTMDTTTDFSAVVASIKAASPSLVFYGGTYKTGSYLAKQLFDAGVKAKVMGGDGLDTPDFISIATTAAAEGDFCTSVGAPIEQLPAGEKFTAAFNAAYPGQSIQAYDAYAYDATNVIIDAALKAAKSLGADKVTTTEGKKAIIANVAATNTNGVTGAISFDSKGDTTNKVITLNTVKSGKWIPWTKK